MGEEYNRTVSLWTPWDREVTNPSRLARYLIGAKAKERRIESGLFLTASELDSTAPFNHDANSRIRMQINIVLRNETGRIPDGIDELANVRFTHKSSPVELLQAYARKYAHPSMVIPRNDGIAMIELIVPDKSFYIQAMLREFGGIPIVRPTE